ncbi:MAG: hypothetical protein AAF699_10170 [Pseudomonadota bacterium]
MTNPSKQQEWRQKTLQYVESVNAFVAKGLADGWDHAGEEPSDPGREELAPDVLAAIREANVNGQTDLLRELWPPAHEPLIGCLEENGQSVSVVCVLPDNSILARLGAPCESGKIVHIAGDSVEEIEADGFFGYDPTKKFFAFSRPGGIEIREDWNGDRVALCPWPTGLEGIPDGFDVKPFEGNPVPTRLIPFPDGKRVLLVSSDGIFVLSPNKAIRLLPTTNQLKEHFARLRKDYPDDVLSMGLSMEHGAISHDGKYIAVGDQDSTHLLFDADLNLVGDVGNWSDYPHYALFSADDSIVAVNSCHFYNGTTLGVLTDLLPGLKTEPYEDDERIAVLQDGARVYAGVARQDEFIIGDASGYVRAFGADGNPRWQLFIGSTVGDIDISADGSTLAVSTYAGFLSIIKMDAGEQALHQIGTSQHMETRRWIFWRNEKSPLIW